MKNLLISSAFAMSLAGAAQAQDMFAYMGAPQSERSSVIVIEPLTASADGYLAVYDYNTATVGNLLGVASIREGANRETRVVLGHPVINDVIVYLFEGNDFSDPSKALDSIEIDIE